MSLTSPGSVLALILGAIAAVPARSAEPALVRSAGSGAWSDSKTWEGNTVPPAGSRVLIRPGHRVVYDRNSDEAMRSIHVGGTLAFAPDRDTLLAVGLLKIQPGEEVREEGFDCEAHAAATPTDRPRPALEVATIERPIDAQHTTVIRLVLFDGMDKQSLPAIVCCGGRMDFHGAPLSRTWLKLGTTARKGDDTITLSEAVRGWRVGDRVIITGTKDPDERDAWQTEERLVQAIDGTRLTLDKPLEFEHQGDGEYRGELANLSRNVIVESADAAKARGHTMYHRNSAGSISYAEFRHLGKEGVLGRYSLHYHLCGDTMRGSSVIGASIWDSGNRWVTVHGTNYLVMRDCVGYRSVGHGFFLEDGTEVFNVFDRNLAVQARRGKPLPKQVLPFDHNDGAGFWWANSLNSFTRNVACENGRYGFRFEATRDSRFNLTLPVTQPDGTKKQADIRTLPFVRFEGNEAHGDGLYGINIGEGVDRVGPDEHHPFVLRDTKIWEVHYAFRPQSPCVLVEGMKIHRAAYGVYHPNYDRHVYRDLLISQAAAEPFNRGHDDLSVQYGVLAVDGLTFAGHGYSSHMPLIQISDDNPTGMAETHMRNVRVVDRKDGNRRALVNLGGGPRPQPKTPAGVPVYLHDYYGPGEAAKVVSTRAKDFKADGLEYREEPPLTGDESRVAHVKRVPFPKPLDPVDDLPPTTVITSMRVDGAKLVVRGTTSDNGVVQRVLVNGKPARALATNFVEWETRLDGAPERISAYAEDDAGNKEKRPHVVERGGP
jgi:G8 domain